MFFLPEAHRICATAITAVMESIRLPSLFRCVPFSISRANYPNTFGVRAEITVRQRKVGEGHWMARDDTSTILSGPLRAGLTLLFLLQITASPNVFSGLDQNFPQLDFQHPGDAHQRVEGRFAFTPVQKADGGLVEAAAISELRAANLLLLPLFTQEQHHTRADSRGFIVEFHNR